MQKSLYLTKVIIVIVLMVLFYGQVASGSTSKWVTQAAGEGDDSGKYVANVVIIKFNKTIDRNGQLSRTGIASVDALFKTFQIYKLEPVLEKSKIRRQVPAAEELQRIYYAYFNGDESPVRIAQGLQQNPGIEYAEPRRIHYITGEPNDPNYSSQTFFQVIHAPGAWDIVKGEQGDVVIAIVDGGTDIDHPDLAANIWINPGEIPNNGSDDDGNGFVDDVHGWNFANATNDPTGLLQTPENANHGTHVAGLACAVTNNNEGVAGASWNARCMPINAGSPTTDEAIAYGYDGILYAANNGAQVISCSWGSLSSSSAYELEVIQYATDLGVVVVASAGNDNSAALHFPSSYPKVLSVTAIAGTENRASFSNYGTTVDVAAPGLIIYSTMNNGNYGSISGTSQACPLAAGVVGLVKTQHPGWSGLQAAEQVRVTADNIDAANPAYAGLLGRGRVNAYRAVTETLPSIRIEGVDFSDGNGDGVIEPGEVVDVQVSVINYLAAATTVNLTLVEADEFITVLNANATISGIGMLEKAITPPFRFNVADNTPGGHPIQFTMAITAGSYQDVDRFTLTVLPNFGHININNIATTVTNIGRIGLLDANDPASGIGFRFKNGPSLLFEGALLMGTGPKQISNAVRGLLMGNNITNDMDFAVEKGGDLQIITPGAMSDQESIGIFNDSATDNPMNIRITQETFAFAESPYDDVILFRYTIENIGQAALNNFHFGIFYDWDIDGGSYNTNKTGYDDIRKLGYAYDTGGGPTTVVGMSVVTPGNVCYRAIFNDENHAQNPSWGIYDGYTDEEKWESISGGAILTEAGPADISFVIATGPFAIEANTAIQTGFALVAGANLADLQANADAARQLWQEKFTAGLKPGTGSIPARFDLAQNYPNPFNPATIIKYQLPVTAAVELSIYNMLGQLIRTPVKMKQVAGFHSAVWDGTNEAGDQVPGGVYCYRLKADHYTQTRKMILVK